MADLEALLVLQEHDVRLDQLRHRRATLAEREQLAALDERLDEVAARAEITRTARDEVGAEESRHEDEVAALGGRATLAERTLYSGEVASPRELQGLQADVDQLRRRAREAEERQLGAMERREPLDAELAGLDAERAGLMAERDAVGTVLASAEREIDALIAAEAAARDACAATLAPTLVAEYERCRVKANGVGVARLAGNTCQGCHLTIPATEVDRIRKAGGESIAYCDNCGCILVP